MKVVAAAGDIKWKSWFADLHKAVRAEGGAANEQMSAKISAEKSLLDYMNMFIWGRVGRNPFGKYGHVCGEQGTPEEGSWLGKGMRQGLLEGSCDLVTAYNWADNPTYNWGNPQKSSKVKLLSTEGILCGSEEGTVGA